MLCSIWYLLYILKNVKNTHGGVLLLVKLQALTRKFAKVTLFHGYFSPFLSCTNGTKSRKASPLIKLHNKNNNNNSKMWHWNQKQSYLNDFPFNQLLHTVISSKQDIEKSLKIRFPQKVWVTYDTLCCCKSTQKFEKFYPSIFQTT